MSNFTNDIRNEFPALNQKVNSHDLTYLDSAATALKPKRVIQALNHFYSYDTANVHRGNHQLSIKATEQFEASRETVRQFINAISTDEIIFTRGTTEAINLTAEILSRQILQTGDEILISEMEHHSNIVPWQAVAKEKNLILKWLPVTPEGELDYLAAEKLINHKTRLLAVTNCSNTLGTVNDVERLIDAAKKVNALVLLDVAQSVLFKKIDVQKLNCDFLAFSGHKLYGPYGIGVLYGKKSLLNELPPYQYGGAMISEVNWNQSTYLPSPQRFEAGTPNISGAIGLSQAIHFLKDVGIENVALHEKKLTDLALASIKDIPEIKFVGHSPSRVNLFSFVIDGVHSSDLGTLLDQQGVAVRTGHHCTMPLLKKFNLSSTVRVSFGVYNNEKDVDNLYRALKKSLELLK